MLEKYVNGESIPAARITLAVAISLSLLPFLVNVAGMPFGFALLVPLVAAYITDWITKAREAKLSPNWEEEAHRLYEEFDKRG